MNFFKTEAEQAFDVNIIKSPQMKAAQDKWAAIINGTPPWKDLDDGIDTINFAKTICQEVAKKTCLDLSVNISGSDRADYIQDCIKQMIKKSFRDKVEDSCGFGGIMLKPNGTYNPAAAIDYLLPSSFIVTDKNSNGDILGAIFIDRIQKGDYYYTRLEYHHFEQSDETLYIIENKAYKSQSVESLGDNIPLTIVDEWKDIKSELPINNVEKPLFAYLKMPYNNTIDYSSPEGVAVFSNALKELKDLDIAWSRKGDESEDSKHLTFIDENILDPKNPKSKKKKFTFPRFVKGIRMGVEEKNTIQEHVATMLTDKRLADINSILAMVSTKCGFSQGFFTLDGKTGMITATQVESDDSETVETITDIREAAKSAIKDLAYAIDKYCDVFFDMPSGYSNILDPDVADIDIFYFRDLFSTFEQDRMRALQLVDKGMMSKKTYLVEYEGYTDKEADKELVAASGDQEKDKKEGLFADE